MLQGKSSRRKTPSTFEKHALALLVFISTVGRNLSTNTVLALLSKDLFCQMQAMDFKKCDQNHKSLQRDHLQSIAQSTTLGHFKTTENSG